LAEVEMAAKRAVAVSRTQEKLLNKHENVASLWEKECAALRLNPHADHAEIRRAVLAKISMKHDLIELAAGDLCNRNMREAVYIYRAFVGFASGDALVRREENDIHELATKSHLLPSLCLVVQQSPDDAVSRAVEQLNMWPFRQQVMCDLLELRAFFSQRLLQVAAGTECTARFHAFAFAPPTLFHQCCDEEALVTCVRSVSAALARLTTNDLEVIRKLEEDPGFVSERVEHLVAMIASVARAQHAYLTVAADARR
jgi:hypothetical protein